MNFVQRSDIGLFDWMDNWWYLAFFACMVLVFVSLLAMVVLFFDHKDPFTAIFCWAFPLLGLMFPVLSFMTGFNSEVEKVRESNISQAFNVSDNQKYETVPVTGVTIFSDFKNDVFGDMKTVIKDAEAQTIHEVTFGFKESGEPFIYETGEVNKEFIEGLKK